MKTSMEFCKILQDAINGTNRKYDENAESVEIVPCEIVQICTNGRMKDAGTGRFVSRGHSPATVEGGAK